MLYDMNYSIWDLLLLVKRCVATFLDCRLEAQAIQEFGEMSVGCLLKSRKRLIEGTRVDVYN